MKIELDDQIVEFFRKFGEDIDVEEAINDLVQTWINVEHTEREMKQTEGYPLNSFSFFSLFFITLPILGKNFK